MVRLLGQKCPIRWKFRQAFFHFAAAVSPQKATTEAVAKKEHQFPINQNIYQIVNIFWHKQNGNYSSVNQFSRKLLIFFLLFTQFMRLGFNWQTIRHSVLVVTINSPFQLSMSMSIAFQFRVIHITGMMYLIPYLCFRLNGLGVSFGGEATSPAKD